MFFQTKSNPVPFPTGKSILKIVRLEPIKKNYPCSRGCVHITGYKPWSRCECTN